MGRPANVGFRVFRDIARVPREVVDGYRRLESTWVSDAMHRFGGMDGNIVPADPGMKVVGPAVTVRVRPGDNLMVYQAFAVAQPGDVLVIECRGYTTVAQWGDLSSATGKKLGLAGVVMDGAIRDRRGVAAAGLPVFAREWSVPNGALKDGPGEVNVPVAVGGVPVLPGDLVIGDANGVVVVPRLDAEVVLKRAQAVEAEEEQKLRDIHAGHLLPPGLEETMRARGCEFDDA